MSIIHDTTRPPADAGRDLADALSRLLAGAPRDPRLREDAARGRLRISVSSVAKEARRSRALIGSKNCAYPQIRNEVLAAAAARGRPETAHKTPVARDVITVFRRENAELKQKCSVLATRVQDAVNLARDLQRKLDDAKRRVARVKAHADRNKVVGTQGHSTVVVPFDGEDR